MTTPDDMAAENRPSHWNESHIISGAMVAALSAGTRSDSGTIVFGNANGVTFGLNAGTLTASAAAGGGGGSVSAGTTKATLGEVVFGNANGLTFGVNGQTVTGSHNGLTSQSTAPGAMAAGTQTATSGTLVFSNSNGITFGMSGSTRITASHNGLTTAALSDHSHGNPTLALTNLSGTTASASNGFTLSLSAAAPGGGGGIAAAAGTQTATSGTVAFVDSNGFTFGMSNSSQVTMSYQPTGRDEFLAPVPAHAGTSTAAYGQSSLYLQPFQVPEAFSGNRLERMVSMNFSSHSRTSTVSVTTSDPATTASASSSASLGNTNSFIFSASAALYAPGAGTNSTRLESYYSNSLTMGISEAYSYSYSGHASWTTGSSCTYSARATAGHSVSFGAISQIDTAGGFTTTQWTGTQSSTASVTTTAATTVTTSTSVSCSATIGSVLTGLKAMVMPFGTTFSAGGWWLADIAITSSTSAGSNMSVATVSRMNLTTQTSAYWPMGFTTTNKSNMLFMGQGVLSVATAALPATIAFSDISARSNEQYFFALRNQSL
jgi:hypothetical protein